MFASLDTQLNKGQRWNSLAVKRYSTIVDQASLSGLNSLVWPRKGTFVSVSVNIFSTLTRTTPRKWIETTINKLQSPYWLSANHNRRYRNCAPSKQIEWKRRIYKQNKAGGCFASWSFQSFNCVPNVPSFSGKTINKTNVKHRDEPKRVLNQHK